jgi:hypothetical protein
VAIAKTHHSIVSLPEHTTYLKMESFALLTVMTGFEECKTFRFKPDGVFWQMCQRIVMVPAKDIIRRCVSANARK